MIDKDIKQTIDFWNSWLNQKKNANIGEFMMYGGRSLDICKKYMQEKQERENPKPLALEQLKNREWKTWVYIETDGMKTMTSDWYKVIEPIIADFSVGYPGIIWDLDFSEYGKTWNAYDRKPKEATND